MIMTQWGCKIYLLLLYNKLTVGLKQQLVVKIVGAYVVVELVVMEVLYLGLPSFLPSFESTPPDAYSTHVFLFFPVSRFEERS